MRAGALDRRIIIETASTTQDGAGQPIETWTTFATVWAGRRDIRGVERFSTRQEIAVRAAVYRMRWLAGVHERMRLVDAGTTYRIIGIADDRRRNTMELTVEVNNPEAIE